MSDESFEYRMVKCPQCGSATAFELGSCRVCRTELKASNTANYFLLGVGGALLLVVFLSMLIYVTRDTAIGGVLVLAIAGLSALVSVVGYIWMVVAAFQVSSMWGLAVIFIPLAHLGFLYKHTDRALMPFILSVFSLVLLFIASFALP